MFINIKYRGLKFLKTFIPEKNLIYKFHHQTNRGIVFYFYLLKRGI